MNRPEEALQRSVVDYLRHAFDQSPLQFWFHIPNQRGTRKQWENQLLKALGVKAGIADLCFLRWLSPAETIHSPVHFIELKAGKGKPSPAQLDFGETCLRLQIPYAICRSVADVEQQLRLWRYDLKGTVQL